MTTSKTLLRAILYTYLVLALITVPTIVLAAWAAWLESLGLSWLAVLTILLLAPWMAFPILWVINRATERDLP